MNSVNQQATTQRARGYEQTIVARHRPTRCVLTQSSGNHPGYPITSFPHARHPSLASRCILGQSVRVVTFDVQQIPDILPRSVNHTIFRSGRSRGSIAFDDNK